ncbi:hypothetical protein [Pyxidicoccus caerfyrddinensis]|uniref:hypothetical protein n=1 Tax=Pyxidicoccus caerfyrddinensis TaxID=2709663 RepID=UPI0013DB5AD5|nr:hypothetical protein [Pyxidicoccus caerfyrddinensis]
MSRAWVVMGALLCLLASPVRAQESAPGGMLGLPLVVREGGWARYVAESSDGPTQFVVRVGAPGKHGGRSGRWLLLEIEVPSTGRVALHFLVEGERFTADKVLLLRVLVPGQTPRESSDAFADAKQPPRQPRVLRRGTETVAGRKLEVTEYSYPEGLTAEWSASVPALGLVRVSGPQPFQLVAFGTRGDPWKGAAAP